MTLWQREQPRSSTKHKELQSKRVTTCHFEGSGGRERENADANVSLVAPSYQKREVEAGDGCKSEVIPLARRLLGRAALRIEHLLLRGSFICLH
jgi:hypothetical protein